jgi:hypothetical protein
VLLVDDEAIILRFRCIYNNHVISVWKNRLKNWLKTAIFTAVHSVVFGMAAVGAALAKWPPKHAASRVGESQ